jgi:creatinine amidohydrolase
VVDAADTTWPTFAAALEGGAPLMLPVGAFEQHGPHLPLATDTIIADAIAHAAARRTGAVVLPALPFGAPSRPRSGGGDRFPAPALRLAALIDVLESLLDSGVDAGARTIVVVSWHWENAAVLWDVLAAVGRRRGVRGFLFDSPGDELPAQLMDELFPDGFPGWAAEHAGRLETVLMAHLAPNLVGTADGVTAFASRAYDVVPTPAEFVPGSGAYYPPGEPDRDLGRRCFDAIAEGVVSALERHAGAT